MGNITHLSDLVIDQIAAGEIIERPSSVIKELLENSIDSGADTISLQIHEGGMARIEVCDNGEGIKHEDLPLSVARHATSKIKNISDLNHCGTHGFRGEALAAISSVSELKIISRDRDNSSGHVLNKIDGIWTCLPSPSKKGTTVIVKDLFF
jgi:DNA mismatch repair protein MutL